MKTRVIVTLDDDNAMMMAVEGENIAQVVLGLLRFGQLQVEQEATLHLLLSRIQDNKESKKEELT